jgi:hypothetical protein
MTPADAMQSRVRSTQSPTPFRLPADSVLARTGTLPGIDRGRNGSQYSAEELGLQ